MLAHSYPPAMGGGETLVYLLTKYLQRKNIEVSVVTDSKYRCIEKEVLGKNIKYVFLEDFEKYSKGEITDKYFLNKAILGVKQTSPDIVHSFNLYPGYLASMFGRTFGTPIVFTFFNTPLSNGSLIRMFENPNIERAFVRGMVSGMKFDHLISYSKYVHSSAIELLNVPKSKCSWHYPGVDYEVFNSSFRDEEIRNNYKVTKDEIFIVVPARVVPRKKIETLVNAAHLIKDLNFKILISSGGIKQEGFEWYYDKIKDMIEVCELTEKVILPTQRYNFEELGRLYASADVAILSSEAEGLGLSILEAIQSSCAIIASRTSGINEIIKHQYNGLLFTVGDHKTLASLIKEYIYNPALRSFLTKNANISLENKFNLNKYIDHHINIYNGILCKSQK